MFTPVVSSFGIARSVSLSYSFLVFLVQTRLNYLLYDLSDAHAKLVVSLLGTLFFIIRNQAHGALSERYGPAHGSRTEKPTLDGGMKTFFWTVTWYAQRIQL